MRFVSARGAKIGDLDLKRPAEGTGSSCMSSPSCSPDGIRGSLGGAEVGGEHDIRKILGGET